MPSEENQNNNQEPDDKSQALQAELQRTRIERAFFERAAEARIIAPADALALLPADALSLNESGQIEGLDQAITTLRQSRPWLFQKDATPGAQQLSGPGHDPAESLLDAARASGLTRDIQAWREARKR